MADEVITAPAPVEAAPVAAPVVEPETTVAEAAPVAVAAPKPVPATKGAKAPAK